MSSSSVSPRSRSSHGKPTSHVSTKREESERKGRSCEEKTRKPNVRDNLSNKTSLSEKREKKKRLKKGNARKKRISASFSFSSSSSSSEASAGEEEEVDGRGKTKKNQRNQGRPAEGEQKDSLKRKNILSFSCDAESSEEETERNQGTNPGLKKEKKRACGNGPRNGNPNAVSRSRTSSSAPRKADQQVNPSLSFSEEEEERQVTDGVRNKGPSLSTGLFGSAAPSTVVSPVSSPSSQPVPPRKKRRTEGEGKQQPKEENKGKTTGTPERSSPLLAGPLMDAPFASSRPSEPPPSGCVSQNTGCHSDSPLSLSDKEKEKEQKKGRKSKKEAQKQTESLPKEEERDPSLLDPGLSTPPVPDDAVPEDRGGETEASPRTVIRREWVQSAKHWADLVQLHRSYGMHFYSHPLQLPTNGEPSLSVAAPAPGTDLALSPPPASTSSALYLLEHSTAVWGDRRLHPEGRVLDSQAWTGSVVSAMGNERVDVPNEREFARVCKAHLDIWGGRDGTEQTLPLAISEWMRRRLCSCLVVWREVSGSHQAPLHVFRVERRRDVYGLSAWGEVTPAPRTSDDREGESPSGKETEGKKQDERQENVLPDDPDSVFAWTTACAMCDRWDKTLDIYLASVRPTEKEASDICGDKQQKKHSREDEGKEKEKEKKPLQFTCVATTSPTACTQTFSYLATSQSSFLHLSPMGQWKAFLDWFASCLWKGAGVHLQTTLSWPLSSPVAPTSFFARDPPPCADGEDLRSTRRKEKPPPTQPRETGTNTKPKPKGLRPASVGRGEQGKHSVLVWVAEPLPASILPDLLQGTTPLPLVPSPFPQGTGTETPSPGCQEGPSNAWGLEHPPLSFKTCSKELLPFLRSFWEQ